jgi:hypothetical protein
MLKAKQNKQKRNRGFLAYLIRMFLVVRRSCNIKHFSCFNVLILGQWVACGGDE